VLFGGLELTSDDKVSYIVLLVQVEELTDLVGSLGSKSSVDDGVGEASNLVVALSHNNGRDDAHVVVQDATSNGLSLSLATSATGVTAHAVLEQESNTSADEHTLLHAEALLVLATGDAEHVALELVAEAIGRYLVRDTLVEHVRHFVLIVDFDGLLLAGGRVGNIDFHIFVDFLVGFTSLFSVSST